MKYLSLTVISVSLLAIVGCETTNNSAARQRRARLAESNRMYEEQIGRLNAKVNGMQDNNAALVEKLNELVRQQAALNQQNALLNQEIARLKQQLANETQAREAAIQKIIQVVEKETRALSTSLSKRQASTTKASGGPVGSGDFYEYTVQSGATLSAIAKAYKVNVQDIKKANGLKSDMIRVGQKLYIPKR